MSTSDRKRDNTNTENSVMDRRSILLGSTTLAAASALGTAAPVRVAQAQQQRPAAGPSGGKPNILII